MRAILEAMAGPMTEQPEMDAWRRDVRRLVQATIDALPTRYGDVLEWKYIDGLSVREIGSQLDVGPKAAESLLTRARNAFREVILEMADTPDALQPPGID